MKRRNFIRAMGIGATVSSLHLSKGNTKNKTKPNIIFVMADDLGVGEIGCYGYQDLIKTPHIDQLAKEGMRFNQCYTGAPVCAPSRCILMTGLHSGHARRRDNQAKSNRDAFGAKNGLVPLAPEDYTVAAMLKNAGYTTAGWGKWGLGNDGTTGSPDKQGFDHFLGYLDQKKAHNYYVDTLWKNGEFVKVERVDDHPRYSHDVMADDVINFIKDNKAKPLFLYLAYTIPHGNFEVPEIYDEYKKQDWPEREKIFASMITRMDKDIGRMMKELKDQNLDKDTIVFFTSDNGPAKIWKDDKFVSSGNQRGIKRSVYQGGINEPMIVRWPEKVPANKVSNFRWVFYDVMPTLAEIAGAEKYLPKKYDGFSVLPTLTGKKQEPHEHIYWEFFSGFQQAVILGKHKFVRRATKGHVEMYDLKKDREEKKDIASEYPELIDRAKKIMEKEHVDNPHWPLIETIRQKKSNKRKKAKRK